MVKDLMTINCSDEFIQAVSSLIAPRQTTYGYYTVNAKRHLYQHEFSVFIEECIHDGLIEQHGLTLDLSAKGRKAFELYGKNAFRSPYERAQHKLIADYSINILT